MQIALTSLAALAAGCASSSEPSAEDEASLVVDREAPLGGNPGVGYRMGGRNECSRFASREASLDALRASPNLAVARIQVLEECSQLGGNHVFAKTELVLRGAQGASLHVGGHGCPTWTLGEGRPYVSFDAWAVVSYRTTGKEEMSGGSAWCIPALRDGNIEAMVIFDAKSKAEAFARTLE